MTEKSGSSLEHGDWSMSNKRIEPMTSSASMRVLQSGATGALLVTAHPPRILKSSAAAPDSYWLKKNKGFSAKIAGLLDKSHRRIVSE